MHYEESKAILDKINSCGRILVSCHKDPDPDSIGSALAFRKVLLDQGKSVDVVCVSPQLFENVSYLFGYSEIKTAVDFTNFDYSIYDLFIILDSSSVDRVTGDSQISNIPLPKIVIDHHETNMKFGDINLVDKEKTSVGEMLYEIFEDLSLPMDQKIAECLMASIVGDTGAFKFPSTSKRTFEIVIGLMDKGADKNKAVSEIYMSEDYNVLRFWGEVLSKMKLDLDRKFVWSAIDYETFEECGKPRTGKETAASSFVEIVKGTDFGFVACEEEKGYLKISFRSRTGFDTSKIASELGGGGHVYASGASIKGLDFDQAVERLLEVVNKHTNKP